MDSEKKQAEYEQNRPNALESFCNHQLEVKRNEKEKALKAPHCHHFKP